MADISNIGPIRGKLPQEIPREEKPEEVKGAVKFQETLQGLVNDVDKMQKTAHESSRRMLTGEIEDVHQVMIAMEEAQTSFQLMMEIRNKLVEAYREIMRMQV